MIKNIWKYSEHYKKYLVMLPFIITLEALIEVCIPYLTADILNEGVARNDIHLLLKTGIIMVVMALLLVVTGFLQSYIKSKWNAGFTKNLKNALFEKISQLSASDIDHIGKASLITRISTDMNFIHKAMGMISSLIKCPIMILLTIVMTFRINSSLSWVFVAIIPIFAIVILLITKLSRSHYRKMFVHYDSMNTVLKEDISNIRTIKSFGRGEHETDRFTGAAKKVFSESYAAERISVLNNPILQLAVNSCILVLLYLGGQEIIRGTMGAGDLFCVITYTNQILGQVFIIALILVPILSAQISMERIMKVLNTTPSLSDGGADSTLVPDDGSVEFDNVSFSYYGKESDEDKYVLRGISLRIPAGSYFGVIGASGASKTTLINLILRYYDATSGTVRVGGRDIREYCLSALRGEIGVVPQKSILFSGTIRENLLFGNENATQEDMILACRAADAYDFICNFPDGFDTVISEKGTSVSGGQRQRLCIARALIRRPKILIMDDSLSAVDTITDAAINRALAEYFPDMTRIVIAQRIASIRSASEIVVLDKGEIDGIGTHNTLLAENKIYAEIDASQNRSME